MSPFFTSKGTRSRNLIDGWGAESSCSPSSEKRPSAAEKPPALSRGDDLRTLAAAYLVALNKQGALTGGGILNGGGDICFFADISGLCRKIRVKPGGGEVKIPSRIRGD